VSVGIVCAKGFLNRTMTKKATVRAAGFSSFFPKLAKRMKSTAKREVHDELEKMLMFSLNRFLTAGSSIMNDYTKVDTVKPNLMRAAISTSLRGELKVSALDAGRAAIEAKEATAEAKAATAKLKLGEGVDVAS